MKHYYCYIIICMVGAGLLSCNHELDEFASPKPTTRNVENLDLTVNNTTAGNLISTIKGLGEMYGKELNDITKLTITGQVNKSDLQGLKRAANILELDLTGVSIYDDNNAQTTIFPERALGEFASSATVKLPTSLTKIDGYAFSMSKVAAVEIPSTVIELGECIFLGCGNLKTFNIPEGVLKVPDNMFDGCESLESVNLPSTITTIERQAFHRCSSLKSLTLPAALKDIGYQAFSYCTELQNLILQEGVETIDDSAFEFCYALRSITIPSTVISVGKSISYWSAIRLVDWKSSCDIPYLYGGLNTMIYANPDVKSADSRNTIIYGTEANGYHTDRFLISGEFYCPKAFTAKEVVYRRVFNEDPRWGEIGKSSQWETISLPFTVTSYKLRVEGEPDRDLGPFNSEAVQNGALPFWLRELSTEGFTDVTTLEAGKPYIISMPYNNDYSQEYNISGRVEFWGENVTIYPSEDILQNSVGPDFVLHPTFTRIEHDPNKLILNPTGYDDQNGVEHLPGSTFIPSPEPYNVEAFTAWAESSSTRAIIPTKPKKVTRSAGMKGIPQIDDM